MLMFHDSETKLDLVKIAEDFSPEVLAKGY